VVYDDALYKSTFTLLTLRHYYFRYLPSEVLIADDMLLGSRTRRFTGEDCLSTDKNDDDQELFEFSSNRHYFYSDAITHYTKSKIPTMNYFSPINR